MSSSSTKVFNLSVVLGVAAFLVSCGKTTTSNDPTAGSVAGGSTGTVVWAASPSPTVPFDSNGGSYLFSMTGSKSANGVSTGGVYVVPNSIVTDSVLKIRVTPQSAPAVSIPYPNSLGISSSNATFSYNCVSFAITINGNTIPTEVMSPIQQFPNSICPSAPTSQVIDLSPYLRPGQGPSGVSISVTSPRYDVYCQWVFEGLIPYNSQDLTMYCGAGLYPVYSSHSVSAQVEFQVDSSSL